MCKPILVVRDKNGKLIRDYTRDDWFAKLNEELDEVKEAAICFDSVHLAEELQDLITVAISWQSALGFGEKAREEICAEVNEKNRKRGYH